MVKEDFVKKDERLWPTGDDDAIIVLENGFYYSSLSMLLKGNEFSEQLLKDVEGWTFSEFICSVLKYRFIDRFMEKEIPTYGWSVITKFLMNSYLSDSVLLFLKKYSLYNKAKKNNLITGVNFAFNYLSFRFGDGKCIRNVLIFLEIDSNDIELLMKEISVKKSYRVISSYLSEKFSL